MRPNLRLCVPAFLAVSVIGAPGCGDDEKTSETAAPATGTDTDAPTTGDPDPPQCMEIAGEATCDATELCAWVPEYGACFADCAAYKTQAECSQAQGCLFFSDGTCELEPLS